MNAGATVTGTVTASSGILGGHSFCGMTCMAAPIHVCVDPDRLFAAQLRMDLQRDPHTLEQLRQALFSPRYW